MDYQEISFTGINSLARGVYQDNKKLGVVEGVVERPLQRTTRGDALG